VHRTAIHSGIRHRLCECPAPSCSTRQLAVSRLGWHSNRGISDADAWRRARMQLSLRREHLRRRRAQRLLSLLLCCRRT
jgi:hypothetical protein